MVVGELDVVLQVPAAPRVQRMLRGHSLRRRCVQAGADDLGDQLRRRRVLEVPDLCA